MMMSSSQTSTQVDAALYRLAVDAALGSAMSGIETNDTALFFPDLDEPAIKKLFGLLHGCFVVLTFNDLRRLPNVATFATPVASIQYAEIEMAVSFKRGTAPKSLSSSGPRLPFGRIPLYLVIHNAQPMRQFGVLLGGVPTLYLR
jgi:hypothetical protein